MLMLISPAKTLDYDSPAPTSHASQPRFMDRSAALIDCLRPLPPQAIAELMSISDKLAHLNVARYQAWEPTATPHNSKQALFAFMGDVYEGLHASTLDDEAIHYLQWHLQILSGLYGLLRPLDLMQAYRLEMGTRLANPKGKDLYAFWGNTLTEAINAELDSSNTPVVVNLASEEYFKSIKTKALKGRLITPVFEDYKGDRYKIISFYAKRARGMMVRYAATHRITDPEALKGFDSEGYAFDPAASEGDVWIFRRQAPTV